MACSVELNGLQAQQNSIGVPAVPTSGSPMEERSAAPPSTSRPQSYTIAPGQFLGQIQKVNSKACSHNLLDLEP